MLNLQDSHPNIYKYLKNGGFTASISGLLFSKIPCDQIIETTINCSSKSTGGLSGKTENIGASEKWMQINHTMVAFRYVNSPPLCGCYLHFVTLTCMKISASFHSHYQCFTCIL